MGQQRGEQRAVHSYGGHGGERGPRPARRLTAITVHARAGETNRQRKRHGQIHDSRCVSSARTRYAPGSQTPVCERTLIASRSQTPVWERTSQKLCFVSPSARNGVSRICVSKQEFGNERQLALING